VPRRFQLGDLAFLDPGLFPAFDLATVLHED